jgi:hypothetical protein
MLMRRAMIEMTTSSSMIVNARLARCRIGIVSHDADGIDKDKPYSLPRMSRPRAPSVVRMWKLVSAKS